MFRHERSPDDIAHRFERDTLDIRMDAELIPFGNRIPDLIDTRVCLSDAMNNREGIVSSGGIHGRDFFYDIASVANLLSAWKEFRRGKRRKGDVALFEFHLEDNIWQLHQELVSKTYRHDPYEDFYVCDPKRRHIHKASVRDRVLHQAIFRVLYPVFDQDFIFDSCSSRISKGTHFGTGRLLSACRKVSKNWRAPAYALKGDVRRFFDSIDHRILRALITRKISDIDTLWLIDIVFSSFEKEKGKGLPLGNVTSQLFANIYLNELDRFVKHQLKARHYFRYCDDFVIAHPDKDFLEEAMKRISDFLSKTLLLDLHPNKVEIRKIGQGIDFLGYIIFPHRVILRAATKKRLLRKLDDARSKFLSEKMTEETFGSIVNSYLGILVRSRNRKLKRWVWKLKGSITEKR